MDTEPALVLLRPGRGIVVCRTCLVIVKPSWKELLSAAEEEVQATIEALPRDLREAARSLPVLYERKPSAALIADGLEEDLLGLFVGEAHAEGGQPSALPPQIFLFLDNLWDFAEDDWEFFQDEVQTTYLHELGHYLGLDEIDLEERGLE